MFIFNWNQGIRKSAALIFLLLGACGSAPVTVISTAAATEPVQGCDGQIYPALATSLYVLPYPVGETYKTGLTNCSSSYHAAGRPDQYAFDFDMPVGSTFTAARAGTVYEIVASESSKGGGVGNYVIINHGDGTFGIYLHSPENGIRVKYGEQVKQGDVLGITGKSGMAGYPHLHLIVVKGVPAFPYDGIAITFRNALPGDVIIKGHTQYEAGEY